MSAEQTDSLKTLKEQLDSMAEDEREIEQKMIKIIQKMPVKVQDRFKMLHMLSDQKSKIDELFQKEQKALMEKYNNQKGPLFDARKKVISGEITDFAEYVKTFKETESKIEKIVANIVKTEDDAEKKEEEEEESINVDHLKDKQGIPDFWSRAIKNNQEVQRIVRKPDEELMTYIKSLEATEYDDPKTLEVKIQFYENEYFSNEELRIELIYQPNSDDLVDEIKGTVINWKDGKDLTKKKIVKQQKDEKTGETRTITESILAESFFNVFTSQEYQEPRSDDGSEEERIYTRYHDAEHVAEDFYDLFVQDAIEFYLGVNEDVDFGDEYNNDSDDGDDGDKKKKKKDYPPSSTS